MENNTTITKEDLAGIIAEYHSSGLFEQDLAELDASQRMNVMLRLYEFVLPKLKAVSADVNAAASVTIEDRLAALAAEQ
jgi:hypothetical protein